jgi:hypothetical protein
MRRVIGWVGAVAVAVAVWVALESLRDTPPTPAPVTSSSSLSAPTKTHPAPRPPTSTAPTSLVPDGRDQAGAVPTAVTYLRHVASTRNRVERRALVEDLLAPVAVAAPPLLDQQVGKVTGPGVIVAAERSAAAVLVPTQRGPVVVELQRVDGRWLVASLPEDS